MTMRARIEIALCSAGAVFMIVAPFAHKIFGGF